MLILINSAGGKTQVELVDGNIDLSFCSEPTKSILQKAFDDEDYVVSPVSEPILQVREIDARRLSLALFQLGLLETVTNEIASLGQAAVIDWDKATIIRGDYPLVAALGASLNLDVDEIFTLAASLT